MLSLLSALALVLAGTADAYGLHRCVHHDALPGQEADGGAARVPTHHAGGHDHGAPASDAHDAGCTCVGDCAGSPGAAESDEAATVGLDSPITVAVARPGSSDAPRPDHAPHFLPFAQAPPIDR